MLLSVRYPLILVSVHTLLLMLHWLWLGACLHWAWPALAPSTAASLMCQAQLDTMRKVSKPRRWTPVSSLHACRSPAPATAMRLLARPHRP